MHKSKVLGLSMVLYVFAGCAERPVLELQQAREAIAGALDSEADIYAPMEFETAQFNLESAEFAITEQQQLPAWGQDYNISLEFLARAVEDATRAQTIATANKSDVFEEAGRALPVARVTLQTAFEAVEAAGSGPITRGQIQSFEGELAAVSSTLNQAEGMFNAGDYAGALVLLGDIEERSEALRSSARDVAVQIVQ